MPVTTRSTWLDLTCLQYTCTSQYLEHTNIFSLKIQQPIPKQKILNFHKSYNFSQKPKSNKVTRVVKVGKFQIFRKVSGKVKNLEELNCQNKYVAHQLIPELPSFVCLFAIAFLRQKQYEGLKNLRKIECYIYILFSSSESPIYQFHQTRIFTVISCCNIFIYSKDLRINKQTHSCAKKMFQKLKTEKTS